MKILIIFILFIIIIIISVINEKKNLNTSFNYLLKLRRKLERINGIKKYIELNEDNLKYLINNKYFYTLVDSGNIGSKINSEFYANYLNIKSIHKFYIGKLKNIKISNRLNDFVIKPYNLKNNEGLLLIKNKTDILKQQKFENNKQIIIYYKKNYLNDENKIVIVQQYINNKIRPVEIKVFSFNGILGIIQITKWIDYNDKLKGFYDKNWNLLFGNKIDKPKFINNIINDSNKFTKSINTFMRIDFLIDENTNKYYFCETSSYPLCANKYSYLSLKIDKYLFKYWNNCFPYNKYSIEEIYNKTKNYKKKELCEV